MDSRKVAAAARQALVKLSAEEELLGNPLLCEGGRALPYETARAATLRALETLGSDAHRTPRQRRHYEILVRCDLQDEAPKHVFDSLGISRRQFYRERREALLRLAAAIAREVERTFATAPRYDAPIVGYHLGNIVGPGGIGSSRAAVEVAERLLEAFKGRVRLVDLAAIADSAGVPGAFADTSDVHQITSREPLLDRIATALEGKTLLVVMDDAEHAFHRS